ncbi:MAG TPA: sigma-70 family RNA polymerase sigma factor [Sedimentisphaerales bacterium]|nr:sigma-70 family RNA polymerase sigma factor [Sedimentisphaerales bacterium]
MGRNDDLGRVIRGCQAGEAGSFENLIDAYANRCYGYFYRLTGDREVSDELLSELFVKLVLKIRQYRGGAFETWLFRVASNVFHDWLREKQRQSKLLEAERHRNRPQAAEDEHPDIYEMDRLQTELEKLDTDTKEVIMLRFYSQMSFREMAALRGEPIGTTLAKVHRGLKKLRELMEQ